MIALTWIQKRVYDALAAATGGGAHAFTGKIDVPRATRSAVNHTLSQLELIGIVRLAPAGRVRRFQLLVPPADVTVASRAEIVRSRLAGKCGREPRPVDRGDFLRRAAEVGLPRFENGRRTVSLGRHAPPRPDARAL